MCKTSEILHYVIIVSVQYQLLHADTRPFFNTYVPQGTAPFIVLVKSVVNGMDKICTGTILDKNWILTAANCVPLILSEANITITANILSYGSLNELFNDSQVRLISEIVVNPLYKPGKLAAGDLALLQVQKPFQIDELVWPAALEGEGWPLEDKKPKKRSCNVIGFGDIDYTKFDRRLKDRKVKALHYSDCACAKRNQWMNLVCLDSMEDLGLCPQDNGAPLICDDKVVAINHMLIVKNNCSEAEYPRSICGEYSVVSYFMYLCPYLSWLKHSVVSVPSPPHYCNLAVSCSSFNMKFIMLCCFLVLLL